MSENYKFIFLYNNHDYKNMILDRYEYFTNFDLIIKPIIELEKKYSLINKIYFTKGDTDFRIILKTNNRLDKIENLFYEFFIGNGLNEIKNFFPNFTYTACYLIFHTQFYNDNDLNQNTARRFISNQTPFNIENVTLGCINRIKSCVLNQYIESIDFRILFEDPEYCHPDKINYNIFTLLFQIYAVLHALKDNYCHNDLHFGNIRIIDLKKEIKITYTISQKKYYIITKYVPIIIDYAKNVIKFGDYDSNNFINTACKTPCNTHTRVDLLKTLNRVCPDLRDNRTEEVFQRNDNNDEIYPENKCFTYDYSLYSIWHKEADKRGATHRKINKANDLHLIIILMYQNFQDNEYDLKVKFKEIINEFTAPEWFGKKDTDYNIANFVKYNENDTLFNMKPEYKDFYCNNTPEKSIKTTSDLLLKFLIPYYNTNNYQDKVVSDYDELIINCDRFEKYKYYKLVEDTITPLPTQLPSFTVTNLIDLNEPTTGYGIIINTNNLITKRFLIQRRILKILVDNKHTDIKLTSINYNYFTFTSNGYFEEFKIKFNNIGGNYKEKYLKYKAKYLNLKEKYFSTNKIGGHIIINQKFFVKVKMVIFYNNHILLFKNKGVIDFPSGECNYNDISVEDTIYKGLFKESGNSIIISIKLILDMSQNNKFIDLQYSENYPKIYNPYTRYYYCKITTLPNLDAQNLYLVPFSSLDTYIGNRIIRNLARVRGTFIDKTNIYDVYKKIIEITPDLQNIDVLSNHRFNRDNGKNIVIYHTTETEDPVVWWNQINKPRNYGNNNISKSRIELSIQLQTTKYMKEGATYLIKKLFNRIKSLQGLISSNGCDITDEYIVSKIKRNMTKGSPGAFYFDEKYFRDLNNLGELNFRELMELFYCCINCNKKDENEESIFLDLLIKAENIYKLNNKDLFSDESLHEINENYSNTSLFFKKYKILNEKLDKINMINIFCNSLNVCNNDFFNKIYKIIEEEQLPLTINYNKMEALGFPLSIREKSFIHGNDTPYIEPNIYNKIGWKSGISKDYLHSGKIINLARRHNYDLATGISGSLGRSLLIFYLLGLNLNNYYLLATVSLNGSFHHSAFECLLSILHFKKFLIEKNLDEDIRLDVDERILDYETIVDKFNDFIIDNEFKK